MAMSLNASKRQILMWRASATDYNYTIIVERNDMKSYWLTAALGRRPASFKSELDVQYPFSRVEPLLAFEGTV